MGAIATKDGTRGYSETTAANATASWRNSYGTGEKFSLVLKPQVVDDIDLVSLDAPPSSGSMARPDPGNDAWRLGSSSFKSQIQTPFSLPLGSALGAGHYNFNQVLVFLPNGSVCLQTSYSDLGKFHRSGLKSGCGLVSEIPITWPLFPSTGSPGLSKSIVHEIAHSKQGFFTG